MCSLSGTGPKPHGDMGHGRPEKKTIMRTSIYGGFIPKVALLKSRLTTLRHQLANKDVSKSAKLLYFMIRKVYGFQTGTGITHDI